MTELSEIRPIERQRVYDLVKAAGVDVSEWEQFAGGKKKAAANPKFCYEWSFIGDGKVVCNLWFENLRDEDGTITHLDNFRDLARAYAKPAWQRRAKNLNDAIERAYILGLPVRVIVCEGRMRERDDPNAKASQVQKRMLDPKPWAVTIYNKDTGLWKLTRGAIPEGLALLFDDPEVAAFEGKSRSHFVQHRRREAWFRARKLEQAKQKNDGRLICEVPNCGFEFARIYGELGEGYAHVHHKIPLSEVPKEGKQVMLDDLAVVCANCHAMIHAGGQCRPLDSLIKR